MEMWLTLTFAGARSTELRAAESTGHHNTDASNSPLQGRLPDFGEASVWRLRRPVELLCLRADAAGNIGKTASSEH